MGTPIKWKSKIFLAKIEAGYGVDPTATGAENAILATNITLAPMEGQDVNRDLELPYLGTQGTIPVGLYSRLSFNVELVASGTKGLAPAWGSLLRACAVSQTIVADTSVTYRPVSDNHESARLEMWIGPTRYVLKGARGTCTFRLNAQGIAYLEFVLTGLFTVPSDVARPTPDLSAFAKPRVVSDANTPVFTIDGDDFVMRNFSLALGNDVQTRFLVGDEKIVIVDRSEQIAVQVEAKPMADFNPFQMALDETLIDVEIQHESAAGRIITLTAPTSQLQRPAGLANAQNVAEWNLSLVPQPFAGNDQWSLVLT